MNTFEFTVKDPIGIHVRPAGLVAKAAKKLGGDIQITKGTKTVDAQKVLALMSLGVRSGETITVSGKDEKALAGFREVLEEIL